MSVSCLNLDYSRGIVILDLKDQEDILDSKTQLHRGIHSTARANDLVWFSTNGSYRTTSYKTSFVTFDLTTNMVDS